MARRFLLHILTVAAFAAGAQAAAVEVSDGWFRTLPGSLPAAGYFTIKNNSAKAVALTAAQSQGCGSLMLHMTHNMNGMMHMMEVTQVEVPAGGSVKFATGGYHLMCMDPKLKAGIAVPVILSFADGTKITSSFTVRSASGK